MSFGVTFLKMLDFIFKYGIDFYISWVILFTLIFGLMIWHERKLREHEKNNRK